MPRASDGEGSGRALGASEGESGEEVGSDDMAELGVGRREGSDRGGRGGGRCVRYWRRRGRGNPCPASWRHCRGV
jgi:hypothetical protein